MAVINIFNAGVGDGSCGNDNASWATCHDAVSGVGAEPTASVSSIVARSNSGTSYSIARAFFPFDTSIIPNEAIITAATFSFYVNTVWTNNGSMTFALVQTTQASNTTLTSADYDQCGSISSPTEGASRISIGASGTLHTFTLNSTGLGWISLSGYTKLGVRIGIDCDNTTPVDGATEADVTYDTRESGKYPVLTITYETPLIGKSIYLKQGFQ